MLKYNDAQKVGLVTTSWLSCAGSGWAAGSVVLVATAMTPNPRVRQLGESDRFDHLW